MIVSRRPRPHVDIRNILASLFFLQFGLFSGVLFNKYVRVGHNDHALHLFVGDEGYSPSPPAENSTAAATGLTIARAAVSLFPLTSASTYTASENHSNSSADTGIDNSTHVVLLVLIKSAPRNYERRQRCRSAWQWRSAGRDVLIPGLLAQSFVVGIDLNQTDSDKVNDAVLAEQKQFIDIVLFPEKDFYYGLTWKALWSFKYALKFSSFDMLLFGDDDVFINYPAWLQWIGGTLVKNVYAGSPQILSRAYRYNGSRWYVSRKQWPRDYYPPYCEGGGYLLSRDVVEALLKESAHHLVFNFDDVFVGVLVEGTGLIKRPTAIPAYFRYTRLRCMEPSPYLILPDDMAHWETISARQKNSEPLCDPPKKNPNKPKQLQKRMVRSMVRRRVSIRQTHRKG